MDKNVFQQLIDLFSYTTLASIFGTLLTTWLLLLGIRWGIDALVNYKPKYRIQLAQAYPVLRVLIWFIAILYIVIVIIQPPQSVIYASLGSLGLALGLASQDAIRNLVAGIMMAMSPRFKIGDMVRVEDHYGEVISLDLSTTKLHTFNDDVITVPNADILKTPISNSNNGELNELVPIELHLPVSIPIAQLKSIALNAAKCSHYVYLKKPLMATVFPVFSENFYYKLTVKAYVLDVRFERAMATDISERIIEALHAKNLFDGSPFYKEAVADLPLHATPHETI
ncbi:mechanosensitive ion channel domain-containing protein [Pseudomonas sp. HK3]|jgi:small-conductance mechanosensitive channel